MEVLDPAQAQIWPRGSDLDAELKERLSDALTEPEEVHSTGVEKRHTQHKAILDELQCKKHSTAFTSWMPKAMGWLWAWGGVEVRA